MNYLTLFFEFFKTGLFAVGGGMATLPFLKNIGLSTGWYSQTALMNMLAVCKIIQGRVEACGRVRLNVITQIYVVFVKQYSVFHACPLSNKMYKYCVHHSINK